MHREDFSPFFQTSGGTSRALELFCSMSSGKFLIIAVDGGAASGKSTTSRAVAERCNLLHVDSGTHYRALTLLFLKLSGKPSGNDSITDFLYQIKFDTTLSGRSALIKTNGIIPRDKDLRGPDVNAMVSHLAAMPKLRQLLNEYQRSLPDFAQAHGFGGIIMEGRDIGTIIFPQADFKFFLYADEKTRMKRRADEGIQDSIAKRDKIDSSRKIAPLACAQDAKSIDNSNLTPDEVVDKICAIIENRAAQ